MIQNGVTRTADGRLLRAGFADFENDGSFDGATETHHTDVPYPAKVEDDEDETLVTIWTGTAWDEETK